MRHALDRIRQTIPFRIDRNCTLSVASFQLHRAANQPPRLRTIAVRAGPTTRIHQSTLLWFIVPADGEVSSPIGWSGSVVSALSSPPPLPVGLFRMAVVGSRGCCAAEPCYSGAPTPRSAPWLWRRWRRLAVEQFVEQRAVEAFAVTVLPWRTVDGVERLHRLARVSSEPRWQSTRSRRPP